MMEVSKTEKVSCDFSCCKNIASHKIEGLIKPKKELNLCEECMKKLYREIGKNIVPRAVENQFKNPKRIKEV